MTATHSIAITSKPNTIIAVNIGVEEAKRLIDSESEDLIVLDVRNTTEYDSAHIVGALSIPLSEFSNRTEELNTSKKIVVYSANGSNTTTSTPEVPGFGAALAIAALLVVAYRVRRR